MNVAARSMVVALVGTLLWVACGSDDNSDDPVALCKQGCAKVQSLCFPDSGGTFDCKCTAPDGGGGTTCTNQGDITAAYKACLEKNTCEEFLGCKIPKCEGGTSGGAGGSGGTGGSGGMGGSGGSDGGTSGTCADLLACCNRASSDQIKTACMMAYNTAMPQGDAACGPLYTSLKASICP